MVRSSKDAGVVETNFVIRVIDQMSSDINILWHLEEVSTCEKNVCF